MKTINLRSSLIGSSVALACLLGGMMLFASPTKAAPDGKSYDVKVKSNAGDEFKACFHFVPANTLKIDGITAIYGDRKGTKKWQAVTKPGLPVTLGFSGNVKGNFVDSQGIIEGDAINSAGTTFTFTGNIRSEACPALFTTQTQSSPFFK